MIVDICLKQVVKIYHNSAIECYHRLVRPISFTPTCRCYDLLEADRHDQTPLVVLLAAGCLAKDRVLHTHRIGEGAHERSQVGRYSRWDHSRSCSEQGPRRGMVRLPSFRPRRLFPGSLCRLGSREAPTLETGNVCNHRKGKKGRVALKLCQRVPLAAPQWTR